MVDNLSKQPLSRIRRAKIPTQREELDCCISRRMKQMLKSLTPKNCLVWTLTADQIEYIKETFPTYNIEPYIFKISVSGTSRRMPFSKARLKNQPSIIKAIAFHVRTTDDRKTPLVKRLKKSDIDTLVAHDIPFSPYKYIITRET